MTQPVVAAVAPGPLPPTVAAQVTAKPAEATTDPVFHGFKEAVFIDAAVADRETLAEALGPGMDVVLLQRGDALGQMARWGRDHSGYDAIHLVTHGSEGALSLGGVTLDRPALGQSVVQAELKDLGHAVKSGGDLLVYGCDVAKGADGKAFVAALAAAAGADVAASSDLTGASRLGGDWALEVHTGGVQVAALQPATYDAILVIEDFETFTDGQTSFTSGGLNFSLTNFLRITQWDTYGSGSSNFYVDTGFGVGRSGGVGSFTVDAGSSFELNGLDLWTSNDAGNTDSDATITLTGTLVGGGTVTQSISVQPTGYTGADWDTTNDVSNFAGQAITSLSFTIDSGANFIAIDNLEFTPQLANAAPTIAKAFSPNPIAVGGVSTLTFTLSNPNAGTSLTGVAFSDSFPAGLQVAATPNASTTGCGSPTFAPAAGNTSVSFSGGTIAASGACTVTVDVTATTSGSKVNTTGNVTSTNGGTGNTGTDTLNVVSPPSIAKAFSPNPIAVGGVSTLTFTLSNPNAGTSLTGVAFSDSFPAGLQVAATPNASTTGCGSPTFAPAAGNTSVSFSGGTIAASGACTVTVDVTATTSGSKVNTSGNVSSTETGVGTDTATATLAVEVLDFGDAADPAYPSLNASDGARHVLGGGAFLGACVDSELDGQPAAGANGDDLNAGASTSGTCAVAGDDEDGVAFTTPLVVGQTAGIDVIAAAPCTLSAWIDFNRDGDWADAGEDLFPGGTALAAGANSLTFVVPLSSIGGTTAARFRCTTAGAVSFTGKAPDGEVEDYSVSLLSAADLLLTETLTTPPPYFVGQSVTFALNLTNNGPAVATNVVVTDPPVNLVITTVSSPTMTCILAGNAFSCTQPSLPVGESAQITMTARIPSRGPFGDTSTAEAEEQDPTPADATATGSGTALVNPISTPSNARPVPALLLAPLGLLALLLMGIAGRFLSRRNRKE